MMTPVPAPKIKVMHVLGSAGPGGAETFFIRLVSALNDGNTNINVLPVVRENSWASQQLTELGIDHRTAPFGGAFDLKTKRILKECQKGFQPDLIQTWMNRATKFMPQTDVPVIARLGGYYKLKYYHKTADYLIGNTEDICDYLIKHGWPKDRAFYIPNFTVPPVIDFSEYRDEVRKKYNLKENDFVILLAGRLHDCKGFDLILYLLKDLPKNVHVLLVGEGALKPQLKAMVDADGLTDRVHFTGWVNQISPLVAAADVWCVPSRVEPLGNTVLDAWGHHIPVIASRSAGPEHLITHNKNGLLFQIDNADEAKQELLKIIEKPEVGTFLANNGAKTLKENFSVERVLNQYIEFYKDIKKRGKP